METESITVGEIIEQAQTPDIPVSLMCESCGKAYVAVVITWLGTADTSLLCMACFLTSTVQIAMNMAQQNDVPEPDYSMFETPAESAASA